jgi:hypothetical protein
MFERGVFPELDAGDDFGQMIGPGVAERFLELIQIGEVEFLGGGGELGPPEPGFDGVLGEPGRSLPCSLGAKQELEPFVPFLALLNMLGDGFAHVHRDRLGCGFDRQQLRPDKAESGRDMESSKPAGHSA